MDSLVGRLIISKSGHDKGRLYLVTVCEDRFAYLCNGENHPIDKPKKKNLRHIQPTNICVDHALRDKMLSGVLPKDEDIKDTIKRYQQEI